MQQHIAPDDLVQLSPAATQRLQEWFENYEPEDGLVRVYIPEEKNGAYHGVFAGEWEGEYEFDYPEEYIGKISNHRGTILPLLDIGQMIEMLDAENYYVPRFYLHTAASGLCDALWKVLKGVLEGE